MSYCKKARRIFYHVLEGSRYLFADERDKRRLLDLLFDAEKEEEWLIYAFCVTDHCAYLVVEADGAASLRRGSRKAMNRFLAAYRRDPYHPKHCEVTLGIHVLRELGSLGEIAECCRQVHRLPLEKGYVRRLDDYWWSSYITYAGEYAWDLVDCRIFSLCFSADPETARQRLVKFHQTYAQGFGGKRFVPCEIFTSDHE